MSKFCYYCHQCDDKLFDIPKIGHDDCLKKHLSGDVIDICRQDTFGKTALMYATNKTNCIKLLCEYAETLGVLDKFINISSNCGSTALMFGSIHGKYDCVKLLLENKANAHYQNDSGYTPLFFASCNGNLRCVQLICEYAINSENFEDFINHKNCGGISALDTAIMNGNLECANYLENIVNDIGPKFVGKL
jgi:ankyrin repeat protein